MTERSLLREVERVVEVNNESEVERDDWGYVVSKERKKVMVQLIALADGSNRTKIIRKIA